MKGYRNILKLMTALMAVLLFAASLTFTGCGGGGGDSYDTPQANLNNAPIAGQISNVLIDPAILKGWMDGGLVNAADSFDGKVVILQVNGGATHIPGAYAWASGELTKTRLEGLADAATSVADGATMDAVLQRSGVDKYTTIVISYASTTNFYYASRAYFTLRYWGFPKDRIKVLNGGDKAWSEAVTAGSWNAASYGLTADATSLVTDNSFSVRENGTLRDDLRYSMNEMLQLVDANSASVTANTGKIINIVQQTTSARAITNAIGRNYAWFAVGGATTGGKFVDAETALAVFKDSDGPANDLVLGDFDESLPLVVHCASGMSATPLFFAADAILGLDVALYDGSTNQWTAYGKRDTAHANATSIVGWTTLPNAAWRVDIASRSNNVDSLYTGTTVIQTYENEHYDTITNPEANQIENEDNDYMTPASDGSGGSAGGDDETPLC